MRHKSSKFTGLLTYLLDHCDFQLEDETEVKAAEAEMDEIDAAIGQSQRKFDVRRKYSHGSVGSRLNKMLSKYKMKLDFRCNSMYCRVSYSPSA